MKKKWHIQWCIISIVLLSALSAVGDEKSEQAVAAFNEGKTHFNNKEYKRAAEAFRKANRLRKSWKLLYNIGQCEAAAKHYGLALDAFEEYLSKGGDDIPDVRQQSVLGELSRLRKMVGFLEVSGRDGDVVMVDDVYRTTLPQKNKVRVAMGPAHIRVIRDETAVYDDTVDILGGELTELNVQTAESIQSPMESDSEAPSPESTGADETNPHLEHQSPLEDSGGGGKPKRVWTWVSLGVGGAAGIAGAVLGGLALHGKNEFMDECGTGECSDSRTGDRDKVNNMALSADVLYGVAGAGIVAGMVLFFLEPRMGKKKEGTRKSSRLSLTTNGLAVTGSF